jgi:hypothetical protein
MLERIRDSATTEPVVHDPYQFPPELLGYALMKPQLLAWLLDTDSSKTV